MAKRSRKSRYAATTDSIRVQAKPGRLNKPVLSATPEENRENYAVPVKRGGKAYANDIHTRDIPDYSIVPEAEPQLPVVAETGETGLATVDLDPLYEAVVEMRARIHEAEQNLLRSREARGILENEMDTAAKLAEEAENELAEAAKKAAYLKHEAEQVCSQGLVLHQQLSEEEQLWQGKLQEDQQMLEDTEQKLRMAEEEAQRINHAKEVAARMNEREMWRLGSSKQGLWLQRRKVQGNALPMARDKGGNWHMPKMASSPGATFAQTMLDREQKQHDYDNESNERNERLNMLSESAQALAERQSSKLEESFLEQLAAREAERHMAAASAQQNSEEETTAVAEEAPPVEEQAAVVEEAPPVEEPAAVVEEAPPVEEPAAVVAEAPPVEEPAAVVEEAPPVEETTAVVEEAPPVEEPAAVVEEAPPVEEPTAVVAEAPPVEVAAAVEQPAPAAALHIEETPQLNAETLQALRHIEAVNRQPSFSPAQPVAVVDTAAPQETPAEAARPRPVAVPALNEEVLRALHAMEGAIPAAATTATPEETPETAPVAAPVATQTLPEPTDPLQILAMRAASYTASGKAASEAAPTELTVVPPVAEPAPVAAAPQPVAAAQPIPLPTVEPTPVIPMQEEDIQRLAQQANILARQHLTQQQPETASTGQPAGLSIAQKVAEETGRQDHLLKEQQTAEMAIAAAMAAARKAAQSAMAISEQVNQQMPALNSRGLAEEDRPYSVERIIADALSKAAVAEQYRR